MKSGTTKFFGSERSLAMTACIAIFNTLVIVATCAKEQGIRDMRTAAEKGLYNRDDAAVMLLAVYQREGKPQEALTLLEKLSAKYLRNYLLRLEMASTLNWLN